jgi:hypothetical protein
MELAERETIAPGIEARQRVHGLPLDQASQPMAGSFLGRLYMAREISRAQYEAGTQWAEHTLAYQRAIAAPRQPGAVDLNATKGSDNYENVEATRRAIVRMMGDKERKIIGARQAVQEEQYSLGNAGSRFALLFTLWTAIEQDQERYDIVPDLRSALNCLVRHYGLTTAQRKEAA